METNDHISYYKELLQINDDLEMFRLMCAYVDGKNFDTHFGDLIPLILSNILCVSIIIIAKNSISYNYIDIHPRVNYHGLVYVHKKGDHYEGIKTRNCFGSPMRIQNNRSSTTACHEATQARPNSKRLSGQVVTCTKPLCQNSDVGTHRLTKNIKPRLTAWNVYGLTVDKLEANELFLRKSTVILMTETWSRGNLACDIFPGYKYFDFPRPNQHKNAPRGAGVLVCLLKRNLLIILPSIRIIKILLFG